MALNTSKMWSNSIKVVFLSKKLLKIAQRLKTSPPDPHWLRFVICLTCTTLCVSKFRHFRFLTFGLSPSPFSKILVQRQTRPWYLIFHSATSLSRKKFLFQKFMTSLYVICPPPLPIKNPGYSYSCLPHTYSNNKIGNHVASCSWRW